MISEQVFDKREYKLSKKEIEIVDGINVNPHFFIENTITKIAATYSVAESTITRMAKHMHFQSIKALQMFIVSRLAEQKGKTTINDDCNNETGEEQIVSSITSLHHYAIDKTRETLDIETINKIVELILENKKIIIFGEEESDYAGTVMNNSLNALGINSCSTSSFSSLKLIINNTKQDIFLIIFSEISGKRIMDELVKIAESQKLKVLLISSCYNANSEPRYNLNLFLNLNIDNFENTKGDYLKIVKKGIQIYIVDLIINILINKLSNSFGN